jgi:predicted DNA-binding transcriptional regulator AlpA
MQVSQQVYLPSSAVRIRYSVSDMTLWRWLRNTELGFPAPLRINGRRFWRLTELEAWEASRSVEGKASSLKQASAEGEPARQRLETMREKAA